MGKENEPSVFSGVGSKSNKDKGISIRINKAIETNRKNKNT